MSPSIQGSRIRVRLEETGGMGGATTMPSRLGNLPMEFTSFVGRQSVAVKQLVYRTAVSSCPTVSRAGSMSCRTGG
jgi:hypothetical protein